MKQLKQQKVGFVNTEPYWRDVVDNERGKGQTHFLMPLSAFETLLDRLDFAKREVMRLERKVDQTD